MVLAVGFTSCLDDPLLSEEEIGEGDCRVTLQLTALPEAAADLGRSRSAGNAIETINNLFVAFYNPDGTLASDRNGVPLTFYYNRSDLTISRPDRTPGSQTETTTEQARPKSGTITVPYGRYYIYSVVNLGNLSETHGEAIQKASTLRRISFDWKTDKKDVGLNCQMSGYFDTSLEKTLGDNVSLVTVNKTTLSLFSWVKRAASKITVAFDAKNLNENVYIYLQSVQVRDIPKSCLLVDENTPDIKKNELIGDGEIYYYSDSQDYEDWPCLARGRDSNTYGNHDNDSPASLFFFENRQGVDPLAQKHLYQNFEKKDNFLSGTYVEVVGYYVNNSHDNPSYGPIKYRFMLGQNTTDDFNATRNTHYKLTLVFNRNANDPDWHIEFGYKPNPPQVVARDVYISYLYNRRTDIPVKVYYDEKIVGAVTNVKAEIIKNPWEYDYDHEKGIGDAHPYSADNPKYKDDFWGWHNLNAGFLTMADRGESTTVKDTELLKERTFASGQLTVEEDTVYNSTLRTVDVPVYTRPLVIRGMRAGKYGYYDNGLSGNNFYVGRTRTAQVKITASFANGSSVDTTINVIQVKRLVNPKGIWRKGGSTKEFRVILKDSESSPEIATEFKAIRSRGPWSAKVVDGEDWVQIKDIDSGTWGTEVYGSTNSFIEFDYKPASTTTQPRFGRIEVKYHDYTCDHVILVSQGLGTVEMPDINGKTVRWHMTNLKHRYTNASDHTPVDVENPLMQGSMFMYGAFIGIKPYNNVTYPFGVAPGNGSFDCYTSAGGSISLNFSQLEGLGSGFAPTTKGNVTTRVCNIDDWYEIYGHPERFRRYYGIMYGEECDSTLNSNELTNQYRDEGDVKGMRGLFLYDEQTNNQLFFPIGTQGYGRRKVKDGNGQGVLRYANRDAEMPLETIRAISSPSFYNIYTQFGALYWIDKFEFRRSLKDFDAAGNGVLTKFFAFDINYTTFGFGFYDTNVIYYKNGSSYSDVYLTASKEGEVLNGQIDTSQKFASDAAFVRLVDVVN